MTQLQRAGWVSYVHQEGEAGWPGRSCRHTEHARSLTVSQLRGAHSDASCTTGTAKALLLCSCNSYSLACRAWCYGGSMWNALSQRALLSKNLCFLFNILFFAATLGPQKVRTRLPFPCCSPRLHLNQVTLNQGRLHHPSQAREPRGMCFVFCLKANAEM